MQVKIACACFIFVLLDITGIEVVHYFYDAWGNCNTTVLDEAHSVIAQLNPFRYRGYYYDTETNLYYLNTRYYDPETGRFISADDTEFLNPDAINGLNLFAYCGNNPVMNIDPSGRFFFGLIVAAIVGAEIGGVVKGTAAVIKGESFWGGFLSGALVGGALGAALFLGGATMLAIAGKAVAGFIAVGTTAAKAGLLVANLSISIFLSAGAGMGAYAINESMNGRKVNVSEMFRQGLLNGVKGGISFFTGMALASTGVFNNLLNGVKLTIQERLKMTFIKAMASIILQSPWKIGLKA